MNKSFVEVVMMERMLQADQFCHWFKDGLKPGANNGIFDSVIALELMQLYDVVYSFEAFLKRDRNKADIYLCGASFAALAKMKELGRALTAEEQQKIVLDWKNEMNECEICCWKDINYNMKVGKEKLVCIKCNTAGLG